MVSSQVVTGVTFSLNIISMLLLCKLPYDGHHIYGILLISTAVHTTFDVLRHKFKVNAASSMDIERALQSR